MVLWSRLRPLQSTWIGGVGGICNYLKSKDTNSRIGIQSREEGKQKQTVWAIGSCGGKVLGKAFAQYWSTNSSILLAAAAAALTSGGELQSGPHLKAGRNRVWSTGQNLRTVSLGRMSPPIALCNSSIGNSDGNSEVGDGTPSGVLNFTSLALPSEVPLQAAAEPEFKGDESSPPTDQNFSDVVIKAEVRTQSASRRVAVIGAGAAGLVAARELVREGHQVVVYEQGQEVGGVWQYDPRVENDPIGVDPNRSRVHSSMYHSLRTNLPREVMGYLDYPFMGTEDEEGRDGRRFPNHREVAKYLEDFSDDFNIRGLVRFGVRVDFVGEQQVLEGSPDTHWVVKLLKSLEFNTKEETQPETEFFDAVVVCNGHYAEPRLPHIPGLESWPGQQIHSHNYRFPHPFQDKVVVVVGSGNSAQDITSEVASMAKKVHQCARAWTSIDPSIEGQGLRHNIWQHPMVAKACPDGTIEFQDGTSVVADIILYCTGYLFSFPFLDTKGYISVDDNRVGPLYKHVFPPALAPKLSFVGLPWKVVPFPLMELQSRWIARLLSGKSTLPTETEMMSDVKTLYEQLNGTNFPKSYTHNCGPYQFEYIDWLAEQSGHEPVETWRKEIYLSCSRNKTRNPATYRDEVEDQQWFEVAMASLERITKGPSKVLAKGTRDSVK